MKYLRVMKYFGTVDDWKVVGLLVLVVVAAQASVESRGIQQFMLFMVPGMAATFIMDMLRKARKGSGR